jgi:LCP family protein required for cell wall assembly
MGRVAVGNGNGHAVLPPGVLSPVKRYRQPERRRGTARTFGRVIFFLIAVIVAIAAGLAGGAFLYTDENAHAFAPRSVQTERAQKRLNVPQAGQPANALVIGYDHRPEDGDSPSRSDTVMLIRADPDRNTISLLSFPRDLVVDGRCPDGRTYVGRINEAYSYCGPAGTLETVRSLTGLPIHYLITVNFQGFREIVDNFGGVWMDVDRRYYNPHGGVYATINLWPGYQKLKGWQALDFVRYRHTDSDLYRLARQQLFVKAMKQAANASFKPKSIPKIFGIMRHNVEIGQKKGEISGKDLISYGFFAYGLPSGNFFQAKIGGLTGTNELHTDPANIQTAVQEFLQPDVEAPEKATAAATGRKLKQRGGRAPSPKNTSVVVLNGNGVAGSAANTSYLLGQKGYRVISPPEGFQANAPGRLSRSIRTVVFYDGKTKAHLAADKMAALFNSADVKPLPRNVALRILANGAMLTVVVGQSFTGRLTPTPVDRTPPRQPPNVRPGKSDTLPAVRRAAAWKLGFPLQVPTVLERSSTISTEVPYRVYKMDDHKTVRLTFVKANEYWGIQETDWNDAPALADKNLSQVIKGRQYDLYYNGPHLHMVVLRAGGASYWVVNTLLDTMSNETMLAIAEGLKPLHK